MAVTVRLSRHGAQGAPFYRIVVADRRKKRDGRFLEQIGTYDPSKKPEAVVLEHDRYEFWLGRGALPSVTVKELVKRFEKRQPAAAR